MDDRRPILIGFSRSELAIGEVGKGDLKTDRGEGDASAIRAVAGGTSRPVQLRAGPGRLHVSLLCSEG
jgi:hypothetical protein